MKLIITNSLTMRSYFLWPTVIGDWPPYSGCHGERPLTWWSVGKVIPYFSDQWETGPLTLVIKEKDPLDWCSEGEVTPYIGGQREMCTLNWWSVRKALLNISSKLERSLLTPMVLGQNALLHWWSLNYPLELVPYGWLSELRDMGAATMQALSGGIYGHLIISQKHQEVGFLEMICYKGFCNPMWHKLKHIRSVPCLYAIQCIENLFYCTLFEYQSVE